jgi:hypothetical protein
MLAPLRRSGNRGLRYMNQHAPLKINAAIRACLDECLEADAPLVCLAASIERLEADPNWTTQEIREVQARAVRILTRLAAGDSSSDVLSGGM